MYHHFRYVRNTFQCSCFYAAHPLFILSLFRCVCNYSLFLEYVCTVDCKHNPYINYFVDLLVSSLPLFKTIQFRPDLMILIKIHFNFKKPLEEKKVYPLLILCLIQTCVYIIRDFVLILKFCNCLSLLYVPHIHITQRTCIQSNVMVWHGKYSRLDDRKSISTYVQHFHSLTKSTFLCYYSMPYFLSLLMACSHTIQCIK